MPKGTAHKHTKFDIYSQINAVFLRGGGDTVFSVNVFLVMQREEEDANELKAHFRHPPSKTGIKEKWNALQIKIPELLLQGSRPFCCIYLMHLGSTLESFKLEPK